MSPKKGAISVGNTSEPTIDFRIHISFQGSTLKLSTSKWIFFKSHSPSCVTHQRILCQQKTHQPSNPRPPKKKTFRCLYQDTEVVFKGSLLECGAFSLIQMWFKAWAVWISHWFVWYTEVFVIPLCRDCQMP